MPSIPVGKSCPWDAFLEWFKLVTIPEARPFTSELLLHCDIIIYAIYLCNGTSRRQISGSPERAQERPK